MSAKQLLDRESSVSDLRSSVRSRSCASFSFFVRAALGLRSFAEQRCEALAQGEAEPSPFEAKLLLQWRALRERAEPPAALAWAHPPALEEEPL